jgi:hypothetical protein
MKTNFLDIRSADEALAADEMPALTSGTTKSEKNTRGTTNLTLVRPLLRCRVGTLQEFVGIVLAILYSFAAFGLGAALLFYTFTR